MSGAAELDAIARRLRELSELLGDEAISDDEAEARAGEAAELAAKAGQVLDEALREISSGGRED